MEVMKTKPVLMVLLAIQFIGVTTNSNAQCQGADIIEYHNGNCLPALVRYVVSPASPKGTNYYWDAGDGKGPLFGGDTLYHEYTSGGSYGISVNITQPNGNKCTITKDTGFLVLYAAKSLGFYADQTLLCTVPATLNLHDTSGNTTGRDWYINGYLYSDHAKDIVVPINNPGIISVTLVVYNLGGCPQIVVKTNYIQVFNIQANFCSVLMENKTHDQITAKFKTGFDTTWDNITEMQWAFPGGNPSSYTGYAPPVITYADISIPNSVTLTVKTKNGCMAVNTKTDLVRKYYSVEKVNVCQFDSARINYLDTNAPGQMHGFNYMGSNLGLSYHAGSILKYGIKFGDSGVANMKLGISYNFSNCTDTLIVPALFKVLPDIADFTSPDRNQCSIPATVHLHALFGNLLSNANVYKWQISDSLGDVVPGSPIGPTNTTDTSIIFLKDGLYSIKLVEINSDGCIDSAVKTNYVRIGVPDNNFKIPFDTICTGKTLSVKNLSTTKDDPNNPLGYDWNFQNQDSSTISVNSTERSPKIVFTYPGMYDLTYIITSYLRLCPNKKKVINAIFVEGAAVDIKLSGNNGCVPLTKTLTADILANLPNLPLSYSWTIQPSDGVNIQNPSDISTKVLFSNPGCYAATLTVTNSNGCKTAKTIDNLVCVGTIAGFTMPAVSCLNAPVPINNTSSLNPDQYKWTITPANGVTINSNTLKTPDIRITKPGCYVILLQTSQQSVSNCYDTVSHQVCVNALPKIVSVYSPDTSNHCAPLYAHFFAKTVNGASFYWDFGDGVKITTQDSQPKHAYLKNKNAGYTIKTVVNDKNGCHSDTVILVHYIKIAGPEPDFSITSKTSCSSETINFANKSTYVYKYYFLYGDNSGIDSNKIKSHFYKFTDYTKDSNIYVPTMFAYDESGCVAIETDTVILYRPPLAAFSVNVTDGCVPLIVRFTNGSKYAIRYAWDFGDASTDTAFQPVHVFSKTSNPENGYKITLQTFSDKGCEATAPFVFISVIAPPIVKIIIAAPKFTCYQDFIHFSISSNVQISYFKWNFGDGNLKTDTSSLQSPAYHYHFPGQHTVSLTYISIDGCKDSTSDSISVFIQDTIPPPAPDIYYVTVTPSNAVEIVFNKQTYPAFASNTVYRYPQYVPFCTTNSATDTVVTDQPPQIDASTQSYGYTLTTTNNCGVVSPFAKPHFTILLRVNKFANQGLILNWTKYIGWDSVSEYDINRQDANGSYRLISKVNSFDSFFVDTMLCPGSYSYYVSAVYQQNKYVSNSNIATNSLDYIYPTNPILLRKATVFNNAQVEVNWNAANPLNFKYYSIDREEGDGVWQNDYATTTDLSFLDNMTNVHKNSYSYRVKVVDRCGYTGPVSNIGKSILLNGSVNNDIRQMNWTAYKLWDNGVKNYKIQLQQEDGTFIDIATNSPQDTLFSDSTTYSNPDFPTCYKVFALQNLNVQMNNDTSVSNTICLNLPSRLFVPDVFTPNNDKLNETFKPVGLSLEGDISELKYDFRIYNRWGELLFETHDVTQGWDGKFKGQLEPEDVYVYVIDAHGLDSKNFYIHGTVTLLK